METVCFSRKQLSSYESRLLHSRGQQKRNGCRRLIQHSNFQTRHFNDNSHDNMIMSKHEFIGNKKDYKCMTMKIYMIIILILLNVSYLTAVNAYLQIERELGRKKQPWHSLNNYLRNVLEKHTDIWENLGQHSWSLNRDSSPRTSKYETFVIDYYTKLPECSLVW